MNRQKYIDALVAYCAEVSSCENCKIGGSLYATYCKNHSFAVMADEDLKIYARTAELKIEDDVEKKRAFLGNWCDGCKCSDCVLCGEAWDHIVPGGDCLDINLATEEELDRAIDLIQDKTEEEKRSRLWEHCRNTACKDCVLRGHKWIVPAEEGCLAIKESPEEDLDKAIDIILNTIKANSDTPEETIEEDPVNRPSHYTRGGIECIDAIAASMEPDEWAGFLKGQVIKYVWRYRLKGKPAEDLKKARYYLDRLIQATEKEEVTV